MGRMTEGWERFCKRLSDALRVLTVRDRSISLSDEFPSVTGNLVIEAYKTDKAPITIGERESEKRNGNFFGTLLNEKNLVVLLARKMMSRLSIGCQKTSGPVRLAVHSNYANIEGMTSAVVCKVTSTGHPLGPPGTVSTVRLRNITQAEWITLRGLVYDVTVIDADNFLLNGIDTSAFAPYVPGSDPGEVGFPMQLNVNNHPETLVINKMKWGTGGNDFVDITKAIDPDELDEDLYAVIANPAYKYPTIETPTDRSVSFTAGIDQSEAVGEALSEEGLTCLGSGGLEFLFARKTHGVISKDTSFSLSYIHTILY